MKRTVSLAVLILGVLFVAFLAGCNTWHGFGKDVSHTGEKIENSGK